MESMTPGIIVIISGPSGVGKSTIVRALRTRCGLGLTLSVSATTRSPRQGERDGVDYFFLSQQEFRRRRDAGEFLECFEVFATGEWYGTLRSEVDRGLREGRSVILEIDVQGAKQVMELRSDVISIFVQPSSTEVLESRLRGRGTESDQVIQRRLERSRRELAAAHLYDFQVINDDLNRVVDEICSLIKSRSCSHHA
jgi:guanylate kinase